MLNCEYFYIGTFPWTFQKAFEGPKPDDKDLDATITSIAWADPKQLYLVVSYRAQGIRFANIHFLFGDSLNSLQNLELM